MGHGHHHDHHLEPPDKLKLPDGFLAVTLGLVVLGLLAFGYGLASDSIRAWKSFLMGFTFTTLLAASGPFFVSTLYLSRAGWASTIRRIPEAFGAWLIPAGVLGLILALGGATTLYEWTDVEEVAKDVILTHKAGYLNWTRMVITTPLIFALWAGFAWLMNRNSRTQDTTGDKALSRMNGRLAAIFLVVFALTLSIIGIDFLMSLHPHWFSTMWAVNIWATMAQSGFALMTLTALYIQRKGLLDGFLNENHVHDLGKLTFAATTFWAYIAFCQFLLMWYSNLPEEFIFWNTRYTHGWGTLTVLLPIIKFIIPFLFLLPRGVKRGSGLMYMCIWILLATIYEIYWWVAPAPSAHEHHFLPSLPWMELAVILGFFGGFVLVVGKSLAKHNLIPIKDPRLHEALHHHQ